MSQAVWCVRLEPSRQKGPFVEAHQPHNEYSYRLMPCELVGCEVNTDQHHNSFLYGRQTERWWCSVCNYGLFKYTHTKCEANMIYRDMRTTYRQSEWDFWNYKTDESQLPLIHKNKVRKKSHAQHFPDDSTSQPPARDKRDTDTHPDCAADDQQALQKLITYYQEPDQCDLDLTVAVCVAPAQVELEGQRLPSAAVSPAEGVCCFYRLGLTGRLVLFSPNPCWVICSLVVINSNSYWS